MDGGDNILNGQNRGVIHIIVQVFWKMFSITTMVSYTT
jgi:hypothetical protein